jgi:hypothetical protein
MRVGTKFRQNCFDIYCFFGIYFWKLRRRESVGRLIKHWWSDRALSGDDILLPRKLICTQLCFCSLNRVTRLGEFSPIWRLISLGFFRKLRTHFWDFFFHSKSYIRVNFDPIPTYVLGYALGDFFTNSSCHPVFDINFCQTHPRVNNAN